MSIILIDTSVFVEILNVPNMNDQHDIFKSQLIEFIDSDCDLLLPVVTIIETGNHIAHNGDGRQRRDCANKFIKNVKAAFTGEAPWRITSSTFMNDMSRWIDGFPDMVMRNKEHDKSEGISLGDMLIVQEWSKVCSQNPMRTVMIWSKDADMKAYCRKF